MIQTQSFFSETGDVITDMVITNLEEKINGRNNKQQGMWNKNVMNAK